MWQGGGWSQPAADYCKEKEGEVSTMELLLIIVIVVLLFGGGGWYYRSRGRR